MLLSGARAPNADLTQVRAFLRLLLAVAFVFCLVELGFGLLLHNRSLVLSAVVLGAFFVHGAIAWRNLAQAPGRAVLFIAYGLLAVSLWSVMFIRVAIPTLLLLPVLAVALAMPFVRGRPFLGLLAASVGVDLAVAALAVLLPEAAPLSRWMQVLVYVSSVVAATVLILVLLYQFSSRIQNALDAAKAAQHQTRTLVEAMPQLVWVTLPDGRLDYVNERWLQYTGLDLEATRAGWTGAFHPDEVEAFCAAWAEAMQHGRALELECRLRRASDASFRWHLFRSVPIRQLSGGVVKWFGTATDIDDRRRSEEASRFLAEASAVLAGTLDVEETLHRISDLAVPRIADWCALYLIDGERVRRSSISHSDPAKVQLARWLHERYPPQPSSAHGPFKVARTGEPELYECVPDEMMVAVARDPEHLTILRELGMRSAMVVPISSGGRNLGAMVFVSAESGRCFTQADLGVARELAHRAGQAVDNARLYRAAQRAIGEAQEAVQVRDDFLSIASHELKTPLTPLQLRLQRLYRQARLRDADELRPEQLEEKLQVLVGQVQRLDRLVDSLLDISRITTHRLTVAPEPLDLAELVVEVAGRFCDEASRASIELTLHVPGPVPGQWDRLRVEQVLSNLLANACKFGAGKPVEVRLEPEAQGVRLVVQDRGIGIAPADQRRVFERFERAVPTRHYGGFGLGLWIARQLVEAMGGTIRLESQLGTGARFEVTLPRQVEPDLRATGDGLTH